MNISEKASYIKGLLEGMNIDKNSNEGKLFHAISDLLEDISLSVLDLEDENAMLNEYIEEIDEDLGALEKECYDCDFDCDCDDEDCDCCCCDDDDCDFEEFKCPSCSDPIFIDMDALPEDMKIICPSCNKKVVVSIEE